MNVEYPVTLAARPARQIQVRGVVTKVTWRGQPTMAHSSLKPCLICFSLAAALLLWLVALSGCTTWQAKAKTTLTVAEATVDGASKVGIDYYQRQCRTVAATCPKTTDEKTCPALGRCWTARRLLQAVLDRTALAVSAAWAVLVAADEGATTAGIVAVQAALQDLAKLLSGAVPGAEVLQ